MNTFASVALQLDVNGKNTYGVCEGLSMLNEHTIWELIRENNDFVTIS